MKRLGWVVSGLAVALALLTSVATDAAQVTTADGGTDAARAASDRVRVVIQTVPAVDLGVVKWGRKTLGKLEKKRPVIVMRPRDSGPMDIVVRVEGYLPVHTRAYTFSDTKVFVKLTKVEEKKSLFGYREELPPEDAGVEGGEIPDGGIPVPPQPATDAAAPLP